MPEYSFRAQQAVTLIDDPEFLGYIVGQMVGADNQPNGHMLISISNAGGTHLQGDKPIATERLIPLDAARPNSAPIRPRARRRANLHTAPQGGLP